MKTNNDKLCSSKLGTQIFQQVQVGMEPFSLSVSVYCPVFSIHSSLVHKLADRAGVHSTHIQSSHSASSLSMVFFSFLFFFNLLQQPNSCIISVIGISLPFERRSYSCALSDIKAQVSAPAVGLD